MSIVWPFLILKGGVLFVSKKQEPSICALKMLKHLHELEGRAREQMERDWNYPERCQEAYKDD